MAAVVQAQVATGAGPTWANAEGGIKYNRADNATSTTPIPVPTATGTNFSWRRYVALAVTTIDAATSLSNRRIRATASPATGLGQWYRTYAVASYVQASSGTMPAAGGANGATPAVNGSPASPSYSAAPTSDTVYDSASVSAGSTGPNGNLIETVLGVDNLYTSGANSNLDVPDFVLTYDEA